MAWHKLADRIGMPVGKCMEEHTGSEFIRSVHYLEQQEKEGLSLAGIRHQLALLALLVRQFAEGFMEHPRKFKLEDFLMYFEYQQKPAVVSKTVMTREDVAASSKSIWLGFAGLDMDGKPMKNMGLRTKTPKAADKKG